MTHFLFLYIVFWFLASSVEAALVNDDDLFYLLWRLTPPLSHNEILKKQKFGIDSIDQVRNRAYAVVTAV